MHRADHVPNPAPAWYTGNEVINTNSNGLRRLNDLPTNMLTVIQGAFQISLRKCYIKGDPIKDVLVDDV